MRTQSGVAQYKFQLIFGVLRNEGSRTEIISQEQEFASPCVNVSA
jgi:hypothetical protein